MPGRRRVSGEWKWEQDGLSRLGPLTAECSTAPVSEPPHAKRVNCPHQPPPPCLALCLRSDGCGTSSGAFQLNIRNIQPNTYYFLAVAPYSNYSPPRLRLSLTAGSSGGATPTPSPSPSPSPTPVPSPSPVPSPPPPAGGAVTGRGTWADPYLITSTPFLSAESNVSNAAALCCSLCQWRSAAGASGRGGWQLT